MVERLRSILAGAASLAALASLAMLSQTPAWAVDHMVQVGGSAGIAYSPSNITINAGDTVTWTNFGGDHNVTADDGSFRCANGCDNHGGDGTPSTAAWTATVTFPNPGTFNYHCEIHGVEGMVGSVKVNSSGPPVQPGTLGLSPASYTAGENSGNAHVTVTRSGGSSGAVAVSYSASAGTAKAGINFNPTSGTLNWADGDSSAKSFTVQVLDDHTVDGSSTVNLALSNPTGGASLGTATGLLTITNTDSAAPVPGTLALSSSTFAGVAGGTVTINVTRTGGTSGAVSAAYATADGTAVAGTDYQAASGTVSFAAGQSGTQSFPVSLLAGSGGPSKSFSVHLSAPTGGASLGLATATVSITPPGSPGSGAPLTADEEGCDELRLAGILDRFVTSSPHTQKPNGLNLSITATGDFTGIAYTGNGPGTPESQLAFSSNPEETTLLRNPSRPQLFSISLTRNDLNSDLVAGGSTDQLGVTLNPTLDPNASSVALLSIDNVSGPTDAKPGRGLSPLLPVCETKLTGQDEHVLQVLTKLARATGASGNAKLAIFRGQGSGYYRIDVYPLSGGVPVGRFAVGLNLTFGPGGSLASGTMSVLANCSGGATTACSTATAELSLIKPEPSGVLAPASIYKVNGSQTSMSVDFNDLLSGSTWQAPLGP